MASRIGSIIAIADKQAGALADGLAEGSKAKSNIEGINGVCRALLQRRTPLLPTAKLVSEEGRKSNPHFPLERTIFNSYSRCLRIWRKAYHDVMNIDADAPIDVNEVAKIDTSVMGPSVGNLVDRLKVIVAELTQRNNVLKKIIDQGVPVSGNSTHDGTQSDDVIDQLRIWLEEASNGPLKLDATGLKVSRRTAPEYRIMRASLFKDLQKFTEEHARNRKIQKAIKP